MTNLHVRFPQYERLHTFCLPFTCRAVRCLTDPDKLIPWAVGEQPLEWALTLMPDGPSQTVCWFFFSQQNKRARLLAWWPRQSTCRQALAPGAVSLRKLHAPASS